MVSGGAEGPGYAVEGNGWLWTYGLLRCECLPGGGCSDPYLLHGCFFHAACWCKFVERCFRPVLYDHGDFVRVLCGGGAEW